MEDKELAKEIQKVVSELNKLIAMATERGIEVELRALSTRDMMHQIDNYMYLVMMKKIL